MAKQVFMHTNVVIHRHNHLTSTSIFLFHSTDVSWCQFQLLMFVVFCC